MSRSAAGTVHELLTERTVPHSLEAERAVLGGAMLEPGALQQVCELLTAADFYKTSHGKIFEAILALRRQNKAVDLLTVSEELRRRGELDEVGGPAALAQIVDEAATATHVSAYCAIVIEKSALRQSIRLGTDLVSGAYDGRVDLIETASAGIRRLASIGRPGLPAVFRREGLDLSLDHADGTQFRLSAIREAREGIRGELLITDDAGRRLWWGALVLSSGSSRETVRKKLEADAPGLPWGRYLEEAAWRFTHAAREGEPIETMTGRTPSPRRELVPRLLYEGEPTQVHADGDTGKSLLARALAVSVHAGVPLPCGLRPTRAAPVCILDWETDLDTSEPFTTMIAAGLGIDPPGILYKRMTRPLVDEAGALAAEFARRGIGLVIVDSMMFAVSGGEGAAFHEPITAFYGALRLFAPAACLVLNHVTNADARSGAPARPFGGAFAFNGPRLIWEAKRDTDVTDATAIVFTCRKANNLPRRPDPFGLRFQPGDGAITVYPFDLAEAGPQAVGGVSLAYRLKLALAHGARSVEALAGDLGTAEDTIRRTLNRSKGKAFVTVAESKPQLWALGSSR